MKINLVVQITVTNMGIVYTLLIVLLFGLVEGITEWLPVSSTGHMILIEEFIDINKLFPSTIEGYSDSLWEFFLVVIQLGAVMAVVVYFFKKLWPFSKDKSKEEVKDTFVLWGKALVACLPAAIIGLLFDDILDEYLYNGLTVSITLIIYGVLFILMETLFKQKNKITSIKELSFKYALIIGVIQLLALIPGTSRSGVTILGAMMIGCSREVSAEFSFYLSIPVMAGASLLKALKFVVDFGLPETNHLLICILGMVIAFVVSLVCVKWLMNFVKKHNFKPFGIYRICLGLLVLFFFLFK